MARFPGTETQVNQAGWHPGDAARCRRSRANGALGLADRRGFVVEVRSQHVRLLLQPGGPAVWLASEAVVPAETLPDPALELLRGVFLALRGQRLEREDDVLVVLGGGLPASALDEARNLLGDRLIALEIEPHGVHELACRLRLDPPL